eukprot:14531083-Heterocapsa_arctica.AAC.1
MRLVVTEEGAEDRPPPGVCGRVRRLCVRSAGPTGQRYAKVMACGDYARAAGQSVCAKVPGITSARSQPWRRCEGKRLQHA